MEEPFLPTTKKNNKRIIGAIHKNKKGLFFTVFGTGEVYKATAIREKEMAITRMDSTIFWGNNFLSCDFLYNDTLYSFGGYGFWKFNGQLRYFNEGAEWQLARLDEEHPFNSNFAYPDPKSGKLYYIQLPFKSQTESKEIKTSSLYELDVKTRTNKLMGEIELPFDFANIIYSFNANRLSGTMVFAKGDWFLLQFAQNRVFKLNQKKIIDFLHVSSAYNPNVFAVINDSLHIYSNTDDSVRSSMIKLNDFELQAFPIYRPNKKNTYDSLIIVLGISVMSFFMVLYGYRKRQKNNQRNKITEEKSAEIANVISAPAFTEFERSIIDALVNKSAMNAMMSVEEFNKMLGLSKKSFEVQKKTRREIINQINHKYKLLFAQDAQLIESVRSPQDKRFYNYVISPGNIEIIKNKNNR